MCQVVDAFVGSAMVSLVDFEGLGVVASSAVFGAAIFRTV